MLSTKLIDSIPRSIRIIRKFSTECLGGYLTLQQYRVLNQIKEGHGQTQISQTLQVSHAAISKMINFLINKNFITRKAGEDRRTQILKLTPEGKTMLDKVRKHVGKKLDVGIESLSAEEKIQLMQGLEVLDKLMIKMKEV